MIKKRILVVEDEQELIKAVQIRLKYSGYEVLSACNGREGLEVVRKEKPDLILLDVMMPEMDGLEMLANLKSSPDIKHIPVIMLTAKAQSDDVSQADKLGAFDYVVKPFTSQILLEKIRKAIP